MDLSEGDILFDHSAVTNSNGGIGMEQDNGIRDRRGGGGLKLYIFDES